MFYKQITGVALMTLMTVALAGAAKVPSSAAASGCPVTISDVRNLDTRIFVIFQNTSGKRIQSYEFGLKFYDTDGAEHVYPETFTGRAQVKTNHPFVATWRSPYTLEYLYPQARAYLLNATFADGSAWADDGTQRCGFTAQDE